MEFWARKIGIKPFENSPKPSNTHSSPLTVSWNSKLTTPHQALSYKWQTVISILKIANRNRFNQTNQSNKLLGRDFFGPIIFCRQFKHILITINQIFYKIDWKWIKRTKSNWIMHRVMWFHRVNSRPVPINIFWSVHGIAPFVCMTPSVTHPGRNSPMKHPCWIAHFR